MTLDTYRTLKKADFVGQILAALAGCIAMQQENARGSGLDFGFVFLYLAVGAWQAASQLLWLSARRSIRRSRARQVYYLLLAAVLLLAVCSLSDILDSLMILMAGTGVLAVYYFVLTAAEAFRTQKRGASEEAPRPETDTAV